MPRDQVQVSEQEDICVGWVDHQSVFAHGVDLCELVHPPDV